MDDYISREAVIDLIRQECSTLPAKHLEAVVRLIPAADVRSVVKADWYIDDGCAYCSNCKNNFNRAVRKIYKFCPMCGADMRDPRPKGLNCECDTCRIPETGTCRYGEEG